MSARYVCRSCRAASIVRQASTRPSTFCLRAANQSRIRAFSSRPALNASEKLHTGEHSSVPNQAEKAPRQPAPASDPTLVSRPSSFAADLRGISTSQTEGYVAYGACKELLAECARQAAYTIPQAKERNIDIPKTKDGQDVGEGKGPWYTSLGLKPTFTSWAQVTLLYMWLLTCRFRMFSAEKAPEWHQQLLDHFFAMAEEIMVTQHGMVSARVRAKYLKDLFLQWRGLTAAYDEGLIKGDAVLAAAVWRNLYQGNPEVDFRYLSLVVASMRTQVRALEQVPDAKIMHADVQFSPPAQGPKKRNPLLR